MENTKEKMTIPVTVEHLDQLRFVAMVNGTLEIWSQIAMDWMKQANDEIVRLKNEKTQVL